jgi:protein phosphatase
VITRALGAIADASADFSLIPVQAGSRILLCSDGVSAELGDATIAELLDSSLDARQAARSLVTRAVAVGGHDNATAVVIDVLGDLVHEDTAGRAESTVEDTIPRAEKGTL